MPAPAAITPISVGDPTRKEWADSVTDWIAWFNSIANSSIEVVPNGSFEFDSDSDGEPDGWIVDEFTGGTFLLDESTVNVDGKSQHGKRSAKFTSVGGGGNGGGTLTSEEFIPCSGGKVYFVQWHTKSSAADVRNLLQIEWFDSTQASLSTSTIFDESAANPITWRKLGAVSIAPVAARYLKIIFTCADDSDATAGDVWIDDVRLSRMDAELRAEYTVAGTYKWKCPTGVSVVHVNPAVGGGGGGGADNSNANSGGGGGGMVIGTLRVVPGTIYTIVIGAGGSGASGAGDAGTDTTFNGITAGGGGGGAVLGGAAGVGGTASGGEINTAGNSGTNRVSTSIAGDGGSSLWSGDVAEGDNGAGENGYKWGAGGSGAGGSTGVGGDGAPGGLRLFW